MESNTTYAALALTQMAIRYIVARKAGSAASAISAIQSANTAAHLTADPDIIRTVAAASSAMAWIEQRGIVLNEAYALIKHAESEGRDLTGAEVQGMLDRTQAALDTLKQEIEQQGGDTSESPAPADSVPEGSAPTDPNAPAAPAGTTTASADDTPPENR